MSSRGFTQPRQGIVAFIRVGVGSNGAHRRRSVHSNLRGFTRAHPVVFGFTRVHSGAPRSRGVYSGSRGFIPAGLEVYGFIRVRVGSLWRDMGRLVHSDTRGSTRPRLGIVAPILACVGSIQSA